MAHFKYNLLTVFLFSANILFSKYTLSQNLLLKTAGDEMSGFRVEIYKDTNLLLTNTEEFSLRLFNLDLSTITDLDGWTGRYWEGDEKRIILKRDSYIPEFDANLSVKVTYEVVNPGIVKKTVELFQPSMPGMYYILQQTSRPAEKPQRYVSFEYGNYPGGFVHEIYPAAGFITPGNDVVGFLTDAGYKNQFTRNTRRRFSGRGGGFVGMRRLPDVNLFAVATPAEQAGNNHYIRQTFGEMLNLDAGTETMLPVTDKYRKEGNATVQWKDGLLSITGHPGGRAGVEFITSFEDQKLYTISFLCKGNTGVAVKLFRMKNGRKTTELEHGVKYIDNFPANEEEWTQFKGSILVPYIENDSVSMFIGTQSGRECELQIKDLQFTEHLPQQEAFNLLPMGEKVLKTTYVFVEPRESHQQFMISAQTRLAEAKGFHGSQLEKMLYANFNMLTWITDTRDFTPFNVPNMNYAPDMYNRDAFFSVVSTYNRELNLAIWEQWGKTQTPAGGVGTIITPLMGSVEAKDNEATIHWLIWAMLNKRRFGAELPHEKIQKAVDYVLNEFDADRDGKCFARFPMSQIDIIDFDPKTDRLAVNQGMLAIALRTIQELGFDVPDEHIRKAEEEYRNFYDPERRHLMFDREFPDIISLTDLEPEFFSLWLFNRPILTDEMVQNHLEQMPVLNKVPQSPHPEYGTTAPILVRKTRDKKGYSFLTGDYQPFGKFGEDNYSNGTNDGYYYNGGSWFRAEYCAYVAGLKHGWEPAVKRMENRVWAEIYLHPGWPFSKEFIPTKYATTDSWWPSTRGLCWNVFMLMANEVAGLRMPEMDPDFR
ncbi:hypothetical protein TBC1_112276 [Lentimicrobium saccharophilum]|uniref:Uncharacterized protein n=2 Tax=Lentimicrobium saccharophilum TaxID=1678841 RepID=A0A0S7C532_9BACT|nr:hypothetical protein TBC1_112276 [Lentimicrobium saccharophilum]